MAIRGTYFPDSQIRRGFSTMKIQSLKCPNCNAPFSIDTDKSTSAFCPYCGTKVSLEESKNRLEINLSQTNRNIDDAQILKVVAEKEVALKKLDIDFKKSKQRLLALGVCAVIAVTGVCLLLILNRTPISSPVTNDSQAFEENLGTSDEITASKPIDSNPTIANSIPSISNGDQVNDDWDSESVAKEVHLSADNMHPFLIDSQDLKLKITSYTYSNGTDVLLINYLVENNTESKLYIKMDNTLIDGIRIQFPIGPLTVNPGHKGSGDGSIWEDYIKKAGISDWSVLQGDITVCDTTDYDVLYSVKIRVDKACWDNEVLLAEPLPQQVVDPTEKPHNENAVVLSAQSPNPVLLDRNGIKLAVYSCEIEQGSWYTINFLLDNQTQKNLTLCMADAVAHRCEIPALGQNHVESGQRSLCQIFIIQDYLDEFGLKDWSFVEANAQIKDDAGGTYSIPIVIYRDAWEKR